MEESNQQKEYGYGKRPLWQWIAIYVVIGGLIYAGIYYFFLTKKGGDSSPNYQVSPTLQEPSPTRQAQNAITLTSNSFSPITLTIKKGEKVIWMNQSGKTATVNSDPHPSHGAYPSLNLGSFANGETVTLIFDTAGTFGYHNHFNSSQTGTITVE